jgi:serine/threonine protein kinase
MSTPLYISGACVRSGLGLTPEEDSAHLIEIEDRPLPKAGAHGAIFRVLSVDGRSFSRKLVKWLAGGFPPDLPDILNALRVNLASYLPEERASLSALPLFLFESSRAGKPFYGYLMREVEGSDLLDLLVQDINAYINLPLETRLHLALQFVEGMNILYGCNIIHADLNGQNLMVDVERQRLSIIDIDGGAVGRAEDIPFALKFEPGWLAPEIDRQIVSSTHKASAVLDTRIDLWSIACGVHYLLFGLSPFFFATTQTDVENYLQRYTWPSLKGVEGVDLQNSDAFDYFERAHLEVPDLRPLFQQSLQAGYADPSARVNPYPWMRVIRRSLLKISSPGRTAALEQVRRYLGLALDEGVLTKSEEAFILDQADHLGVPRVEVARLIEEEFRNWWGTVNDALAKKQRGLKSTRPDAVARQIEFFPHSANTGGHLLRAQTLVLLLIIFVCLSASAWFRSSQELAPSSQQAGAEPSQPEPTRSDRLATNSITTLDGQQSHFSSERLSPERLSSEVKRLLSEQGYSGVKARVKRSGKVYLYGVVNSAEEKQDIIWAVGTVRRVRKVISHLRVTPQNSNEEVAVQRMVAPSSGLP